jgi:hypothetical protein
MKIRLIFFLLLLLSCSSKYQFSHNQKGKFKRKETIKLSGFIVYDMKKGNHQFYKNENEKVDDTLHLIKRLRKHKGDYHYIQPLEAKVNGNYYDFTVCSEKLATIFFNNIRTKNKIVWTYINNEYFIILVDSIGNEYLSFESSKPYIGLNPDGSTI